MPSGIRSAAGSRAGTRPGTRTSVARHGAFNASVSSARPDRGDGAASPASAGTKRKERDFESDAGTGLETNINVVVRCRGRNGREVKENSAVVVNTDGIKGESVELYMGPNALSNKTYNFDRVFSPAADQSMVFDDTVKPILEEMLAGFNCTIFAYGQTGTGKTYTMSGDMTDTLGMLSDEAGIVPRVLQQLFHKLKLADTENCVKCSFIELYNEDLRDLLAVEDGAKLKIFDDVSRRGHASTIVQGMEEKYIKNAAEGIKVLQDGSLKRQVAATKCNDLSSRSHTVFTVTAYVKKTDEHGVEGFFSAGKLNLVDLAGSENIQRSGAENKRAAEAGLINKSLLTLGRVINALVDRNSHIPYRESKLTRLLQDSLGGRTKTCIIATISPAKTNLEETISTLDYAFRAKNIRNKPQFSAMFSKKALVQELATDIEKLRSELIAARQRNGVYLSNDAYEELTAQNESRRIVSEEQAAKIETIETNLRNKVQEFHALTTSFMELKKDHEETTTELDETKGLLEQTEIVLETTRKILADETGMRKAHEQTEEKLTGIAGKLIHTLGRAEHDVDGLHAKNKRKSDLQVLNRVAWEGSQSQVVDSTSLVERRIQEFRDTQAQQMSSISERVNEFAEEELQKYMASQNFLGEQRGQFDASKESLLEQSQLSKEDMDKVLEEINVARDNVKSQVREALQATIPQIAEKIAVDVLGELTKLHSQLHNSYSSLGKDSKTLFEDLVKHITIQRSESDNLRRQLQNATNTINLLYASTSAKVLEAVEEERKQAADDKQKIADLLHAQAAAREARLAEKTAQMQKSLAEPSASLEGAVSQYTEGMQGLDEKDGQLLERVKKSRDQIKNTLRDDWNTANGQSTNIQANAKSVHAETVRVVDAQVENFEAQMETLDELLARGRSQNASWQEATEQSVQSHASTAETSFDYMSAHFKTTYERVKNFGEEMDLDMNDLQDGLEPLDMQLCQPLANLREGVAGTALQEYQPTGDTPQKAQYHYPTSLPRTNMQNVLGTAIKDEPGTPQSEPAHEAIDNDTMVFADPSIRRQTHPSPRPSSASTTDKSHVSLMSLREVNPNVTAAAVSSSTHDGNGNLTTGNIGFDPRASVTSMPQEHTLPLFKRSTRIARGTRKASGVPGKGGLVGEGRENMPPSTFAQSASRRKSPRLN